MPVHVQCSEPDKEDIEGDLVAMEVNYPPAWESGSVTLGLSPSLLSGLPAGGLTSKWLQVVGIGTG